MKFRDLRIQVAGGLFLQSFTVLPLPNANFKNNAFAYFNASSLCDCATSLHLVWRRYCCGTIMVFSNFDKGPSIKDICTKSRKIELFPLVRKMSELAQPLLPPCPCGHKRISKNPTFLHQKCGRRHLKYSSSPLVHDSS